MPTHTTTECSPINDPNAMETIHGYPIIETTPYYPANDGRTSRIILVRRGSGDYVTAMHCEGDESWGWGHYLDDLGEAYADYLDRGETLRRRMGVSNGG